MMRQSSIEDSHDSRDINQPHDNNQGDDSPGSDEEGDPNEKQSLSKASAGASDQFKGQSDSLEGSGEDNDNNGVDSDQTELGMNDGDHSERERADENTKGHSQD